MPVVVISPREGGIKYREAYILSMRSALKIWVARISLEKMGVYTASN